MVLFILGTTIEYCLHRVLCICLISPCLSLKLFKNLNHFYFPYPISITKVMEWIKNSPIDFSTFLGEFSSQGYEKHIVDHWSSRQQILLDGISQEQSYKLQIWSAVRRTGHTKLLVQIRQTVHLYVRLWVNRCKKISIFRTVLSEG